MSMLENFISNTTFDLKFINLSLFLIETIYYWLFKISPVLAVSFAISVYYCSSLTASFLAERDSRSSRYSQCWRSLVDPPSHCLRWNWTIDVTWVRRCQVWWKDRTRIRRSSPLYRDYRSRRWRRNRCVPS